MTDNVHRCQKDLASIQPSNKPEVDEALITKIRGSIFDIQEQQSKLQTHLDELEQDSKNKTGKVIEINKNIAKLEVRLCLCL